MKKKKSTINFYEGLLIVLFTLTVCNFYSCNYSSKQEKESAKTIINNKLKKTKTLDELNKLVEEFNNNNNIIGEILARKELGKRYRDSTKFAESLLCLNEALALSEAASDTIETIAISNEIGNDYCTMHILNKSLGWQQNALAMCNDYDSHNNLELKICKINCLRSIGCAQYELGNMEAADSAFRKCLLGYQQTGMHLEEAYVDTYLAKIFEGKHQLDSALIYYQLALIRDCQGSSKVGIAICYSNIGHILEKMGDYTSAAENMKSAYAMAEPEKDVVLGLKIGLPLAEVNIKLGKMAEAANYLRNAETKAKKIKSFYLLSNVYQIRSLYEQKSGNLLAALSNLQLAQNYTDSMYAKIDKEQNQYLKISYEQQQTQKKQLENTEQEETLKKRNLHWAIGIMVTVLLLSAGAIAILIYFLRLRRRSAKMQHHMETVKNNFFTNVTHEFRTPLTVILGFSHEFLTAKTINIEEWREKVSIIERQGKGLLQLINQLLEISKVHATIGEPEWKQGNINPYIRMIVDNYRQLTEEKNIKMVFTPENMVLEMDFVPQYIRQIIGNLISNAIKYTPERGHIYITTSESNNIFVLAVNDSGCGIPKQEQKHIFEIFYQGENSRDKVGTGVGLSLVQQMVEAMNGTINVISDVGEGSSFIIRIPIRHGVQQLETFAPKITAEDLEKADQEEQQQDNEADNKPNILIIEDHNDVAYFIGSCFQGQYALHYALNGEEGLEKAKAIVPDLIITDLMMPGIGGLEVCRRIRSSQILNHIPIIIITARNTEEDRINGLKTGADAYLVKPFNAEELNVRVKNLLEQRQKMREKFLKAVHEGKESHAMLTDVDKDFVRNFTKSVFAHTTGNTVSIETLAESLDMTTIQLNRKIRAITGQTTIAYVLQLRMQKAKELLDSNVSLPIAEVASKCGYEITYFSRIFKQTIGLSPMQYRNKKKQEEEKP